MGQFGVASSQSAGKKLGLILYSQHNHRHQQSLNEADAAANIAEEFHVKLMFL